jgi:hypothetical protein
MKKKTMIALLVICILLPATLGAAIADLSLGATAMYNVAGDQVVEEVNEGDFSGLTDISNYTFGADLRVKFLLAEVDVVGMYGQRIEDGETYHEISTLVTGGVSFDLLNLVRVGIGMGPNFLVTIDDEGNAVVQDSEDNLIETSTAFKDAFLDSPVSYRATVDFNVGNIMLGLNYTVDSSYTFSDFTQIDDLFDADQSSGQFGISMLFSLL